MTEVFVHVFRHGSRMTTPLGKRANRITGVSAASLRRIGETLGEKIRHTRDWSHGIISSRTPLFRTKQTREALLAGLKKSGAKNHSIVRFSSTLPSMMPSDEASFFRFVNENGLDKGKTMIDYLTTDRVRIPDFPTSAQSRRDIERDLFGNLYQLVYSRKGKSKLRTHDAYHLINVSHLPNVAMLKAMVFKRLGRNFTEADLPAEASHVKLSAEKEGVFFHDENGKHLLYTPSQLKKFALRR